MMIRYDELWKAASRDCETSLQSMGQRWVSISTHVCLIEYLILQNETWDNVSYFYKAARAMTGYATFDLARHL